MRALTVSIIALLIIMSIMPVIPLASPLSAYYINGEPKNNAIIAYTSTGTYNVYVYSVYYDRYSGNPIVVVVTDNAGNIVLNKTISLSVDYGVLDMDANDTGVLIAYYDYNGGNKDIHMVWVGYDGSTSDLGLITNDGAAEENPVVKWGNGYWLVGFVNYTAYNLTVRLYDKHFNLIFENSSITLGQYGGVDYRERAFYSPATGKFYIVVRAFSQTTNSYEIALVTVDPTTLKSSVNYLTETSDKSEVYPSYGLMYRRFYAELLGTNDALLVVYGYYSGSTNIDGVIVNLTSLSITPVTISTEGGDSNIYPWIAASSTEWLVVYSYNNNIYAKFVYPNGTTSALMTLAVGSYGYATAVYNGQDYTIIYGNQTTGDYDLYAMRIATDGKRGKPFPIATTAGENEDYEYPLILGTLHTVFYVNEDAGKTYLAVFDLSEVSEPTQIPTRLTVSITKNDGGDGYLEAGDSITVTGKLIDTGTGLGVEGKTITATLYEYMLYDNGRHHDVQISVATASNTTGSDGTYTIKIDIPSTAESGTYYVYVSFAGDDTYSGSSNQTGYFLIFHVKPVEPTWETIPADISAGPALLVKNGQVIITDPQGDERTDIINTTGEEQDVDIRSLQLAIDSNYLYIKAGFTGSVKVAGEVVPAIAFAIDFTPDNPTDGWGAGYTDNFKLVYGWDSQTHINNSRGWDIDFVASPIYPQAYNDSGRIPLFVYIAYQYSGRWYYKELQLGYASYSGSTIEIYLPLDTIRHYNPHLASSGNQSIMLFSAVFAVNTTTDNLVPGTPYANWYDVPGALTINITPSNYLNQGFIESYKDDKKTYGSYKSWELDTRFILNIDLDHNKFYGNTKIFFKNTTINANPITYSSGKVKAFIGNTVYKLQLIDKDNPKYNVYGKTIYIVINGTTADSASTDALGLASITHAWTATDWKKNVTISFTFPGDSDYTGTATLNATTRILYLINITSLNYTFIDVNKDGVITRGDKLNITATVKAWNGTAWVTAPDGVLVKFIIHSPDVVLGTAPTQNGVANLLYTFTGNEQLLGTHTLEAAGDGATSWTPTYPGAQITVRETFSVLPAPEPPILPVILLVAILLFIIIKKRK